MTYNKGNLRTFFIVITIFILPLMLISCASAAPPVLQAVQSGSLDIITPLYEVIPQNTAFEFYWHVLNQSTLLTNQTTTCTFHLYSAPENGTHIYDAFASFSSSHEKRDFEVELNRNNFSKVGRYSRLIECNTTTQTGSIESFFEVTPSGLPFQDESLSVMIGLSCLMAGLIALSFIWKPEQVFLKTMFIVLSLLVGLIISQTAYALSVLRTFYNMMSSLNTIFLALIIILVLLLLIQLLVNLFRSLKAAKKKKKERNEHEIV